LLLLEFGFSGGFGFLGFVGGLLAKSGCFGFFSFELGFLLIDFGLVLGHL